MYGIELSIKAAKAYLKLPAQFQKRIDAKLTMIAENPYGKHNNVKSLQGMHGCYRLRIGDWRIVYEIVDDKLKIYVIKIGQRKEVYR